jgi:hypothetical protein
MVSVAEARYAYVRDSKTKVKKTSSIFGRIGKGIDVIPQVKDDAVIPIE